MTHIDLTERLRNRNPAGRLRPVQLLLPHWKALAIGLSAAIAASVMDVLRPWPIKLVIDSVLGSKAAPEWLSARGLGAPDQVLTAAVAGTLLIAVLGSALAYVESRFMARVGQWVSHNLRVTTFERIQRLPVPFHDKSRTGDLISRVTSDVETIRGFLTSTLLDALLDALTLAGMIALMAWINLRFTVVALSITPILFLLVRRHSPRIKAAAREARRNESDLISLVTEVFSSIRVVQAFNQERNEKEAFEKRSGDNLALSLRASDLKSRFSPVIDIVVATGAATVLWYGAHLVMTQAMSAGELVLFLVYVNKLYAPVRGLAKLPAAFSKPAVAFERIQQLMETPIAETTGSLLPVQRTEGHLEFEDVSFRYEEGGRGVRQISFRVEPGQLAAFVGPTGAGKTTIANLIGRFYEPDSGTIRIDGVDLSGRSPAATRSQLGLVLQDTQLFHGTVRDNIAYGRPDASFDEVQRAAAMANAHEFIESLELGYDTVVGERGVSLSGGQRQRIGIARAFLRDAPILVLDEPASALDASSEGKVYEALYRLAAGRTCIVITHHVATVQNADVIFVMSNGRIVDRGRHDELVKRSRIYGRLLRSSTRRPDADMARAV